MVYRLVSVAIIFFFIGVSFVAQASESEENDEYLAKTVISQMVKNVPDSVEKICVIKIAEPGEYPARQIMRLDGVDKRLVYDTKSCSRAKTSEKMVVINYFGRMKISIKEFEKYRNYFVIGASVEKCGAEIEAFIFTKYSDGAKLVGHKAVDRIECEQVKM